ncbi:hypothetical protein JCM10207_000681 [Rhodosporidiobolus poonsookiae]
MSASINWTDPAVTSFLADILGTPSPTVTTLAPSVSAALQSMIAQNAAAGEEIVPEDPLRAMLPEFTYAMPVQVVILGVTVALLGMLLVHLLFTIRYHAPLSKVNYCLQTVATVLSIANVGAQLHITMTTLISTGRQWPYMFDYIEVAIPKKSWSTPQRGAWFLLQGLNSAITHSTHIQFLTMLFPSTLETRLIMGLLGPLAIATAALYFTDMSSQAAVNDLGDAIRNTANSSLTLLYTMALFIWGLTLNRSRAWRTDGGTAAFGTLAMILGVLGTAVNFVEIKEERMRWLPGVVTCILLWQSWVGFWWWVGAGMWAGEAEDVEKKREKQRRKEEQRRRKREGKRRATDVAGDGETVDGSGTRSADGSLRRRLTSGRISRAAGSDAGEGIEMNDLAPATASPLRAGADADAPPRPARSSPADRSGSDSNSSTISSSRPSTHHFYTPFLSLFSPFLSQLRTAHDAAAVAQAAKPSGLPDDVRRGFGIRAMMMRGKKERGERRQAARGTVEEGAEMDPAERRAGFELDGGARLEPEEGWVDEDVASGPTSTSGSETPRARPAARRAASAPRQEPEARDDEDDDVVHVYPPQGSPPIETGDEPPAETWRARGADGQQAWWWRGWVGRARLRDVSQW